MASFKNYLPFINAGASSKSTKTAQVIADPKKTSKLVKSKSVAIDFTGGGVSDRANFEEAPYDFDRLIQAIDTDSYVKQSYATYKELIWKEGWQIIAEDPDVIDYLRARIDLMELMMRRSFQDVLTDLADQLVKFANGFLAKARGDISPYMPINITAIQGKDPVSGYYVVPTETMKIQRDKFNMPQRYQQDTGGGTGAGENPPEWKIEDMVHFVFDRKPGRIFGTPFIVSVIDDIIALRQIEEDVQNLVHKELFPLYVYRVGSEEEPADQEEIDNAFNAISNLRTEGGLIVPERHEIDVLGADSHALEAIDYLRYFQERVVAGLGLSPHHLGIMNEGGNRAITDRLDISLYDKVKTYQRYIEDNIRINIFNELLLEGGFDPINIIEHRAYFKFNEIDTDTQIKKDAAAINKWSNNVTTLGETRLEIGAKGEAPEEQLLAALTARMAPDTTTTTKSATGATVPKTVDTTPAAAKREDAAKPATKGKINPKNTSRSTGNQIRPQNQHGRRMSPNVRHSMNENNLSEIVNLLDEV